MLSEDEVRDLLPMNECVDVLDDLFKEMAAGTVSNMNRYRVPLPRGSMQVMAGMSSANGATGLKTYVTGAGAPSQMVVLLFDLATAAPIAFVAANALGAIRTGAASGVATRHMARADAKIAAIIGTGSQAHTQLAAVAAARPLDRALVYSRTQEKRERFAAEMAAELGIPVEAVATAEDAVAGADIVCTITNSRDPVFDGTKLKPGTHVNAAGSNGWIRREVDDETIKRSALIACDDISDAKIECGELIWAAERRIFRWETAVELRDVVGGRVAGRPTPDAITLFESQGLAVEDVAAGMHVYRKALERGIGRQVDV
ncbi:MAG: ornithine cyclodeaminase family protein [Chloroflexi bacterium]|nr:ornithine cyclodeaminase family protein [Chloroflexota bacterium]MDA1173648.1 ornithine cyclodeaminase family protein [Chloroflexota bacterium]